MIWTNDLNGNKTPSAPSSVYYVLDTAPLHMRTKKSCTNLLRQRVVRVPSKAILTIQFLVTLLLCRCFRLCTLIVLSRICVFLMQDFGLTACGSGNIRGSIQAARSAVTSSAYYLRFCWTSNWIIVREIRRFGCTIIRNTSM